MIDLILLMVKLIVAFYLAWALIALVFLIIGSVIGLISELFK